MHRLITVLLLLGAITSPIAAFPAPQGEKGTLAEYGTCPMTGEQCVHGEACFNGLACKIERDPLENLGPQTEEFRDNRPKCGDLTNHCVEELGGTCISTETIAFPTSVVNYGNPDGCGLQPIGACSCKTAKCPAGIEIACEADECRGAANEVTPELGLCQAGTGSGLGGCSCVLASI